MKFLLKEKFISIILVIVSSFLLIYAFLHLAILNNGREIEEHKEMTEMKERIQLLNADTTLNDKNDIHLEFAYKNGLKKTYRTDKAFKNDVDSLVRTGELVLISDKKAYAVERLTHSHPYLRKEARNLLNEIGVRFNKKQIERGMKPHKIIVTSLLRTERSQSFLRRLNINATKETTAHLYGTTFDIASTIFVKKNFLGGEEYCFEKEYQELLQEVMRELRKEGRCVVVREFMQACYHITVVE